MLSLGSLTSTFTPPSGCVGPSATWLLYDRANSASYYLQGQTSASSCFPPNYDPQTIAYYSPGVCPSGYTSARPRDTSTATGTHTCCPTFAVFEGRETSQDNLFMSTMACQSFFGGSGTILVTKSSGEEIITTTTSFGASDVLNAYGIIVALATETSSSTPAITTTSQTSNIEPIQTSTSSQITPAIPASTSQQTESSRKLSTAEKVGIGGGIAGGILLLTLGGALGYYIMLSKRQKSAIVASKLQPPSPLHEIDSWPIHEMVMHHPETTRGKVTYGLYTSGATHELSTDRDASELATGRHIYELGTGKDTHGAIK
ncbi:unnamed protein product [Periconia digitata]|uniref:Uncharacterized protein n=1 Tax=Periconia digitata TaxID=1303443 RepID=A0A9W4XMD5_9PLEO|nr:unnamed protein product [Periconia digitata]